MKARNATITQTLLFPRTPTLWDPYSKAECYGGTQSAARGLHRIDMGYSIRLQHLFWLFLQRLNGDLSFESTHFGTSTTDRIFFVIDHSWGDSGSVSAPFDFDSQHGAHRQLNLPPGSGDLGLYAFSDYRIPWDMHISRAPTTTILMTSGLQNFRNVFFFCF